MAWHGMAWRGGRRSLGAARPLSLLPPYRRIASSTVLGHVKGLCSTLPGKSDNYKHIYMYEAPSPL